MSCNVSLHLRQEDIQDFCHKAAFLVSRGDGEEGGDEAADARAGLVVGKLSGGEACRTEQAARHGDTTGRCRGN